MSIQRINWRTWTPESLRLALDEGKPVLLAITATWCHWCHVMDRTTFGNDEVIAYVNSHFIPIHADNDRRPDLNTRYNMGGWPTVAFLMPDGETITGATYLPPKQMLDLMARVIDLFEHERSTLEERAAEARQEMQEAVSGSGSTALLSENIPKFVLKAAETAFDHTYGGFGREQKFPLVSVLEMLLMEYRRTAAESLLEMLTKTLDAMMTGGIFDVEEGGFFRYSTLQDWSTPHFEKMLEDNAGLLSVYVAAYALTGFDAYLDTAKSIIAYLENTLHDPVTGAYFGSQDADEEYYRLPISERREQTPPSVDRAIPVNWNGLTADAYMRVYEATGEREYLDRALEVIDFVDKNARESGMFCHYYEDRPMESGLLTDQVFMGLALLRAYECTAERRYLELAKETGEVILRDFQDPAGGFFDVTEERRAAQALPVREKSLDENASAARFLTRLAYYAHRQTYRDSAELALRSIVEVYEPYGLLAAPYAAAVLESLQEPVRIAISGPKEDIRTQVLIDQSLRAKSPSSVVEILQAPDDTDEMHDLGISRADLPQAAICQGAKCRITEDAAELDEAIREMEGRGEG